MKKLMIAFAAVAVAAVSQAASFTWTSSNAAYALANPAGVVNNGSYDAGTNKMKGNGTWNYVLTIYSGATVVDTFTGALNTPASGKISFETADSTKVSGSTTYDYVLEIGGQQTALNERGKTTDYDYSNASLSYTYAKGSVTTEGMGATSLTSTASPTSWTVSGITPVEPPEPTPEPTSAMLMLLGVAGLALRRKAK